jgi:hypothetical protein
VGNGMGNLGCWQNNVGQEPWILSDNPGRNRRCLQVGGRMFASRYSYTAKVSRQVLRFFKQCFLKPASPALYERELRPLLMAYL